MWVYLLLLAVILFLIILSIIFLVRFTHDILKKFIDNKFLAWSLSFLSILLFIPGLYIDFVNAIVVDMHLIIIIFIVYFIFWLRKRLFKKDFNKYVTILLGVIFTFLILSYGYYTVYNVKLTSYNVSTKKDISNKFRIVQITDSHIGNTLDGKKFSKYMDDINKLSPDIVVITGDFVDDGTSYKDMVDSCIGLGKLKTKYGVYFVYGNHDKGYYNNRGYGDLDIRRELEKNHVTILEDSVSYIGDDIVLVGRSDAENSDRKSLSSLVSKIDKDKYIITLDHQPNDYKNEINKTDLVLSGHTHGGQLFPLGPFGVLFGSIDKVYGIEKRENTTFIVSSGISDWALKFKTGTISEYVLVDIKNNK